MKPDERFRLFRTPNYSTIMYLWADIVCHQSPLRGKIPYTGFDNISREHRTRSLPIRFGHAQNFGVLLTSFLLCVCFFVYSLFLRLVFKSSLTRHKKFARKYTHIYSVSQIVNSVLCLVLKEIFA